MQIFSHIFCIFMIFLLFQSVFSPQTTPKHTKSIKKHCLSVVLIPLEVIHHRLKVGGILFSDLRCRGVWVVFLPSELIEVLRGLRGGVLLAVVEHARQEPLQHSCGFIGRVVTAVQAGEVTIHLPPSHLVQEVIGCDSALANYLFIELEGGYAFFDASSVFAWSWLLSG